MAVAFNRSKGYYKNKPGASYVFSQSNWDNNYSFIEIFTQSKGVGYFLKLKGGFAFHNKKGLETILLELFYNQGLKKMQEHTVNYRYYYTPVPGSGNSGSGIRFNNKGTTFGGTLGFPVYFFKNKKVKKWDVVILIFFIHVFIL